jgi:hypothetical protein
MSTISNGFEKSNGNSNGASAPKSVKNEGKLIVLTAPLTESIDHAGYFIQMAMASLPIWLEGILNRKYPNWRDVERYEDGSAKFMRLLFPGGP